MDQIRTLGPFQENYPETSHLEDPEQDTQINLMGIND